jgi:hypothetical protein
MTAETFFQATNTLALAAWIALVLFADRKLVTGVLCAVVVPAVLALAYASVIGWKLGTNAPAAGDVMTLTGLREVFTDDWVFAAAWTHYLAFDMVVGAWIARDSVRLGLPWLLIEPLFRCPASSSACSPAVRCVSPERRSKSAARGGRKVSVARGREMARAFAEGRGPALPDVAGASLRGCGAWAPPAAVRGDGRCHGRDRGQRSLECRMLCTKRAKRCAAGSRTGPQ